MSSQAKQTILRFSYPCGTMGSSQWRQSLKKSPSLAGIDLDAFAVHQSSTALSITARAPQASELLRERVMDLMRAVADVATRTLDVELLDLSPNISNTHHRWSYNVPRWVVARPKDDWEGWRSEVLGVTLQQKMLERLSSDLAGQINVWSGSCPDLDLSIEDYGRPMVLKDAIVNGPKAVSAMARLNVVFSSAHRLEGALYAGLLNVTGFGRVYRSGYQED